MENELFEKTPVPSAYMKLALPIMFSMVLTVVYNMVDTYFIARTGNTDLVAGVSLSAPVFTMMIGLGDIFGLGGSSVISRLFGQKKYEDGKRLSVFCFYAAILLGILVTVLMLVFHQPALKFLGADADTMEYASQYYTVLAFGAPFIVLSFTPNNVLRTEGFAAASMIGGVLGSVVNMILDPLFISGFGMGAAGAALATVIGYVCTIAYYVWFLLRKPKYLSIHPRWLHVSRTEILPILAIGIPAAVTNLTQSVGTALLNRSLVLYGNEKVAAMGIAAKISSIASLILISLAFGGQPLTGYNYGAKNHRRLKEILKFAYGMEAVLALGMSAVLSLAAPLLMKLFMEDSEIVSAGTEILRVQLVSMVFVSVVLVTTCTFQSAGKAMGALVLSISRQGIIFAVVLTAASALAGYYGVIWAQPIADILTAGIGGVIFFRTLYREMKSS